MNFIIEKKNDYSYTGRMLVGKGVIDYLTAILQPWLYIDNMRLFFLNDVAVDAN